MFLKCTKPLVLMGLNVNLHDPDLDFSFDEAGSILFVLKHRQRVKQVVNQPIPVLLHLLSGSSW